MCKIIPVFGNERRLRNVTLKLDIREFAVKLKIVDIVVASALHLEGVHSLALVCKAFNIDVTVNDAAFELPALR